MDMNHEWEDRLDDYLLNRMPADERAAFEQELESNPGLQAALEEQRLLKGAVEAHAAADLKAQMQKVQADMEAQPVVNPAIDPRWWWVLLAVSALGIAYYAYQEYIRVPTGQELYAQYYAPMEPIGLNLRNAERAAMLLQEIDRQYRKGDYNAAITTINMLDTAYRNSVQIASILAVCYLEEEMPDQTIATLMPYARTDDRYFYDDVQWFWAMALFQKGETEQAKILIKAVALNYKSEYFEKARAIADKMGW